jgi:ATP cone domain.
MTEQVSTDEDMYVLKRDGSSEIISFDKILKRVKNLGHEFNLSIQYTQLVMKVIDQLYNNIKTSEINELTAQQCASMASLNPDYNR